MNTRIIMLCLISLLPLGCVTHRPLTRKSTGQALSVSEIHQQQVLDNLSMFASDANAWPFFSVPEGGKSSVSDSRKGSLAVGWLRSGFGTAGLSGDASRALSSDWTLVPENDPHKLILMRCAYQNAVNGCSCNPSLEDPSLENPCVTCKKRIDNYNLGHKHDDSNGDNCCLGSCWFQIGTKACVPKHCTLVGKHCDTYVWVEPGWGQDELSKLTMQILEYSFYEAVVKPAPTKEVTEYRDLNGRLTTKINAAYTQTYKAKFDTVPQKDPMDTDPHQILPTELFHNDSTQEFELKRSTDGPSRFLEQRIRNDIYGN
ncbi:MAG: hypothetical protein ACKVH8_24025 [Pirellulales bacterium]